MAEWTIREPGRTWKANTEDLVAKAHSRDLTGMEMATDSRGDSWRVKEIPGVFSSRSWLVTLLLAVFVGSLGIDRFYLGKNATAVFKLLTFGGLTIWTIVDIILIVAKRTDDKEGLPLAP